MVRVSLRIHSVLCSGKNICDDDGGIDRPVEQRVIQTSDMRCIDEVGSCHDHGVKSYTGVE